MTTETGAATIAPRKRMGRKQKRLMIIAGIGAVLAIALALILTAISSQVVYFYTPSEALAKHVPVGQFFRIGGLVKDGSWQKDGENNTFVLSDGKGTITAHFTGILPDLFREGQGIVALGKLDADGVLVADEVLAKHDEKYMPPEVTKALKESGQMAPAKKEG